MDFFLFNDLVLEVSDTVSFDNARKVMSIGALGCLRELKVVLSLIELREVVIRIRVQLLRLEAKFWYLVHR